MEYAKNCYDAFVDDMLRHGTFHANVFATIHREATNYLFDKMPVVSEERIREELTKCLSVTHL